jgi:hypothetical protein
MTSRNLINLLILKESYMKKLITSKDIMELLEAIRPKVFLPYMGNEASNAVDSSAVQKLRLASYLKKGHDLPTKDVKINNFKSDPLCGTCSWYENYNEKESYIQLNFLDMDFWMFGYTYQPYINYPGVYLTIKGNSKSGFGSGVRYDPGDVKSYVYAPGMRNRATPVYAAFSTLLNKAHIHGLEGIEFPENWDEVPYTV